MFVCIQHFSLHHFRLRWYIIIRHKGTFILIFRRWISVKNEEQLKRLCAQALEKGLISLKGGWDEDKAEALYNAMAARQKPAMPKGVTVNDVYNVVRQILVLLEDTDDEYVPSWAKQLMAG